MFEIIPNWHPVFVHFTVALLSMAVGLVVVTPFIKSPLKEQWQTVARWALWFGAGFTIITGLTGLYAYNTVAHDTPSHAAMTDHRNWAIATIILFLTLAAWSIVWARNNKAPGMVFVVCMVIAGSVLASTAWRGGEVVYRYGLGVMSLPKAEGEGHSHSHGGDQEHGSDAVQGMEGGHDDHGKGSHDDSMSDLDMDFSGMDEMKSDDGHDHEH